LSNIFEIKQKDDSKRAKSTLGGMKNDENKKYKMNENRGQFVQFKISFLPKVAKNDFSNENRNFCCRCFAAAIQNYKCAPP